MSDSRHCPECGNNIGILAVFKAPLPNRIRCPHCGQRLQHTPIRGLVAVALVLMAVGAAGVVALHHHLNAGPARVFLALVVGLALLEVAFVIRLWYGNYRLIAVGKPRPPEGDESW